ncbi:hypothetical protein ADUPG1_010116 [Aduncisulcus paluster]|uniref:SGTA homodimerisation domain-containing protein n=1 Tax=Aduncisulcus paluster TaxID=2918883 RepID=A0ABQ5KXY6_9EUKA|nr:hypothetical protein ADUPG1_010116 [Aduncisulcus paluster]|eukprot:gnl/Carplike_NY0171/1115_a1516_1139.p1 GENE.gnl/Carplike_NY0171/1115_a1516_1139~~gnl/Carplike_NY0171/1115_a1516_1139.p1  ORF type:complete len:392 (-),score=117.00 gnl/Carplike_NY0171/1115_a1516_1139:67-1242(-)
MNKELIEAIITHLRDLSLDPSDAECISVGIDCICDGLHLSEPIEKPKHSLEAIYKAGLAALSGDSSSSSTSTKFYSEEEKTKALNLKDRGNELFKQQDYPAAIKAYSDSLFIFPNSHIVYSNRALAYTRLGQHQNAIEDCDKAISLEPTYVKSYSRKGNALMELRDYSAASEAFKKAMELEPTKEDHRKNYNIARKKMREDESESEVIGDEEESSSAGHAEQGEGARGSAASNPFAALGGMGGLGSLLSNPAVMQMAQGLMGSLFGGQAPGASQSGSDAKDEEEEDKPKCSADARPVPAQEPKPADGDPKISPEAQKAFDELCVKFPALKDCKDDPEVKRALQSPKLPGIVEKIKTEGPMAAIGLMSDPDFAPLIGKIMNGLAGGFPNGFM